MVNAPDSVSNDSVLATLALSRVKAMLAVLLALALLLSAVLVTQLHPVAAALLAGALAWAVMIDIDRYRLPDLLTLPMIAGGLGYAAMMWGDRLLDHAIGAVAGYLSLVIVAEVYRRLRGIDGLGRGDAKLLAAAGAWLGWAALPSVIFLAASAGLVFAIGRILARRQSATEAIAFGPFIAAGFWALVLADGRPFLFSLAY
jgi:prepilin signal peptidase PulO-like enzyme (type II secretory pathway)